MTTTSYLLGEIENLFRIIEDKNNKIEQLEQQVARLEAWSTMLFTKLYAIECGDCNKNMVACKCDE